MFSKFELLFNARIEKTLEFDFNTLGKSLKHALLLNCFKVLISQILLVLLCIESWDRVCMQKCWSNRLCEIVEVEIELGGWILLVCVCKNVARKRFM